MSWIQLALSWTVAAAFLISGHAWLSEPLAPSIALASFPILFAAIMIAAFAVVREADRLALQLGEPYGTLVLTLSVVLIEVILIASIMLGPGEFPTIGRDAVFSVMMITLNLVTGVCLLLGGLKHDEQEYNAQGAVAYLSMIAILTGLALVLPNFTTTGGGEFSSAQAIAFSVCTILLYGAFLAMQMGRYRRLFVQPLRGGMTIAPKLDGDTATPMDRPVGVRVGRSAAIQSFLIVVGMVAIVILAHNLAILIDHGIAMTKAPVALGGVLIAIIVFTPESLTAVRAALANQTQRVINLCLGAFVSTVGLTVPAVLIVGEVTGKRVVMGLPALETGLFLLTLVVSTLTFMGQKTTAIQGLVHVMLFAVYTIFLFS